MPRTIIYDSPKAQAELEREESAAGARRPTGPSSRRRRRARRRAETADAATTEAAATLPRQDDYIAKIAKYVPAEVVAVSAAGFAAFNPTGRWVWAAAIVGVIANVIFLAAYAVRLPQASRPRPYFYFLSAIAYVAWAAATIPQVRDKFGLGGADDTDKTAFILFAAAFGLPLLDTLFANVELSVRGDD